MITLDTTRADHLGCYSGRAKTPKLDALAARGVLFAHATVQVPLTLPSHASIMTGTYPTVHGLRHMEGFVLDKSHPSIASISVANGFATGAFVGSRVLAREFGMANGFDVYDDDVGSQAADYDVPGVFAERRAGVVTDRALDWLKANGQRRFFLWAHYFDPHAPYDPPQPYKRLYAGDPYSGELAYTDEQVGRLLDGLQQMGIESRTLVAVIGDHGESLGEHGEATHGVFLYDSTLHVPFIMAGPGVPKGKVVNEQVRSIDVMPTVLGFLNLPAGTQVQGVSLWPLIQQDRRVGSNDSYAETLYPRMYMGWSELRALRTDSWKLIVAPRPELYNVERDPGETRNLISESPSEAVQMQKRFRQIAGDRTHEKISATPTDAKTVRQLESLGYVGGGTPRETQLGTPAPDPKDRVEVLKLMNRAEDLLAARKYAEAALLMEQAQRLDPKNPRGLMYLASAFEQMGQYARAVRFFQHALDAGLATDKIYSRLGVDYLHLGRMDRAVEAMEQASRMNPGDLNNLRNLGMACVELGRIDDAEKAFRAILAQNDRYAAAYDGLGLVAVQRKDVETARREFEKAVEINPEDPKSLLDLGTLYQQIDQRERSLKYLRLFVAKAPKAQFADQLAAVREAIREMERN